MTPRELALRSLVHIESQGRGGDDSSEDDPKINIVPLQSLKTLSGRDRDLARELVNGVLRNRSLLDWVLKQSLARGSDDLTPYEQNILRLGAYQLLFLDRIPHYAAVDQSVRLSKRFGRHKTVGLTNAVLRDIIKKRPRSLNIKSGDSVRDLSIKYSHPEWLVKRWVVELGPQEAERLLAADNRPAQVTASAHPGKTTDRELCDQLEKDGFCPRLHALAPGALVIEKPEGLFGHRLFLEGFLHIQDAASQLVGRLLDPALEARVLDMCAAPGGKACWLAMHHPRIILVAADISRRRLRMIRDNRARLGLNNILLLCADGLKYQSGRRFDAVLLDAPCSGLGTLRRRLDLRWRIKEADIQRLASLQQGLLESASRLVRPGGILIYSTCTLAREENQGQIERFLAGHPEFKPINIEDQLPLGLADGYYMQTWPQRHDMDGMFAVKLQRRDNNQ